MAGLWAVVKLCGERGVPLFEVLLFRALFGFVPLGLYIWWLGGPKILRTRRPMGHLVRSLIGLTGLICSISALRHLPLTESLAIQFSAPIVMTALSAVMLRESVGAHRWGAVLIGFIGVLVMVRPGGHSVDIVGVGFALAATLCTASAAIAVRQMSDTEHAATMVFYATLAALIPALIGSALNWVTPDPTTFALLVAAGVLGSVGQMLITEAVKRAPVNVVAPFDYAQLLWATVFGFLIWGDVPGSWTIGGAVIVAASGLYILHRDVRSWRRA